MATRPSASTRKRSGGTDDGVADPALPQKKRARHRVIGAIALCLLAAVVVPLLLEPEPSRPVADVAIVVPSRDTPLPARAEAKGDGTKAGADAKAESAGGVLAKDGTGKDASAKDTAGKESASKGAVAKDGGAKDTSAKDATAKDAAAKSATGKDVAAKDTASKDTAAKDAAAKDAAAKDAAAKAAATKGTTDAKAPAKGPADAKAADAKAADAKSAKTETRRDEIGQLADSAQAKARGETVGRYLLQVGAFGGEASASAAVDRVEAVGLRAFTEKIKTERGERVRVRVGPFPSRESAEQARTRLKSAGIEAAVIAP